MCILCVVQKWSRRVATMLPWLVIPLILLWALSQLLPPGLRFEITSPRLACVVVLLLTLFWYEILMPQLSIWRARRSARLRERRRTQALELQKLRKTATRRCRNCLTPYRDQNPGGGRFMCSYCGHISKRPVLDLPGPVGSSGIISDLVGKNSWMCSQDWPAEGNGNWVSPAPRYWVGGSDDRCLTEKSYSGVVVFACKLLSCFFSCVKWLCRKVFRFGSSRDNGSSDADHKGSSSKRGENVGSSQESRGEKARRKAEEKRQARLEREMLEEEERKQREEVARLVEERRKLRDEKLEAERQYSRGSASARERDSRKETEKRKHERRKEKDKGSNKSNSDGEDLEKRASRESERKRGFEKKSESDRRDSQKTTSDNHKSPVLEPGHGNKAASKPRYFGRMTGTFLSSSRGFSGASFFGRNAQSAAALVNKASKPPGFVDHSSGNKRDAYSAGHVIGKFASVGDSKISGTNFQQPVGSDVQPRITAPKKSWHQLFTRSAAVSPYPDTNASSFPNQNGQLDAHIAQSTDQRVWPNYSVDNQTNFGLLLPSTAYPSVSGSFTSNPVSHLAAEKSMFPPIRELGPNSVLDEAELFEDPCYDPDPVSLLGPVSESLDLGAGFISNDKLEEPRVLKNVSALLDVNKPSPIESPMSRLRVSEEKHAASSQLSCNTQSQESHSSNLDDQGNAQGTWQMWGSPLAQDGLGLVGGPSGWFLPLAQNKFNQENIMHSLSSNLAVSQVPTENHALPGIHSPQHISVSNQHNGGAYSPLGRLNDNDLWTHKVPFESLPVDGESNFLPPSLIDNIGRNDVTFDSPKRSIVGNSFERSPANCWSKRDWAPNGPQEAGDPTTARPNIGGLFPTNPDVQSVWSFDQKATI